MSPQTLAKPKKTGARRGKKKKGQSWLSWWPLAAGIAATLAAVKTAEILPLLGPGGILRLQLLYPYALLFRQPQLGLPDATGELLSQIILYAQFPLYGLYASLATRWKPLWTVLIQLAVFHLLGFGVLWLLARP